MFDSLKEKINTLKGISTKGFNCVFIETIGACTNRCFMCANRGNKSNYRGKMSNETFELTIKKLKENNFSGELHLYAQNEPFLDKTIIPKIYHAHKELPLAKIIMISNFTAMNEGIIQELIDAPIHNLSCSLYALDPENYKKITGKDNFKKSFINQIHFIKAFSKKIPYSYANYIIKNDISANDFEFIKHYIFNLAPVSYCQAGETLPLFNNSFKQLKPSAKYISECIYTRMRISENGDISMCPIDTNNVLCIGNIHNIKGSLNDCYNSDLAIKTRQRMFHLNNKQSYCQYCSFRRSQTITEYLFNKKLDKNDKMHHKLLIQRNNAEIIKQKIQIFNEIFKNSDEANWLTSLEKLRYDFYKKYKINTQ